MLRNHLFALWAMARPLQLLSVILVYGLGALVAYAEGIAPSPDTLIAGLTVLLLISASIHYTNEYADYETDSLTDPTPYSGGSGVLPRGMVPRRFALHAAWGALILGGLLTVLLVVAAIIPPLSVPILLVGAFFGWMYSLPPLKLAWRGWGEVDNALLGGWLLPVYGYVVQAGQVDWLIALCFTPFTLLVFLNLLATTWADRDADAQVGKFTLATRVSVLTLRRIYVVMMLVAFGLWAGSVLVHPKTVIYAGLMAMPLSVYGAIRYTRTDAPHASVNTMVVFLVAQLVAWLVVVN